MIIAIQYSKANVDHSCLPILAIGLGGHQRCKTSSKEAFAISICFITHFMLEAIIMMPHSWVQLLDIGRWTSAFYVYSQVLQVLYAVFVFVCLVLTCFDCHVMHLSCPLSCRKNTQADQKVRRDLHQGLYIFTSRCQNLVALMHRILLVWDRKVSALPLWTQASLQQW